MDLREWSTDSSRQHPWAVARARFFRRMLRRAELGSEPVRGLDAGSGDGWLAQQFLESLPRESSIVCWDEGYSPEHLERLSSIARPALRFSRTRPPQEFDLLFCLDVLEHVEADREFLETLVRENLTPGGHALLSVPAWRPLFSSHDARLGHVRRYSPTGARRLLEECGLSIVRAGGLFHSLLVPRLARRLAEALGYRPPIAHAGNWSAGPIVTRVAEAALGLDNQASLLLSELCLELPGLSWWALCRKPS